jgi:hypothetical protein
MKGDGGRSRIKVANPTGVDDADKGREAGDPIHK